MVGFLGLSYEWDMWGGSRRLLVAFVVAAQAKSLAFLIRRREGLRGGGIW